MAEIKITTKFNDEVILQSVDVCDRTRDLPMFGRMDSIMSTVIRLCDQGVRKTLKELGWKAPGEESEELRRAKLVVGDLTMLMEARQIEEVEIRKLLVPLADELGVRRASEHSVGYLVKDVLPLLAAQNRAFQAQLETSRKTLALKEAELEAAKKALTGLEREELETYRTQQQNGPAAAYYLLAEELGVPEGGSVVEAVHAKIQAATRKAEEADARASEYADMNHRQAQRMARLEDEMRRYLPVIETAEQHPKLWADLTFRTGIATANGYRAALDAQPYVGGIPVPEPTTWTCPTPGCGHTITHAEHLVARLDNACPSCFLTALSTFTPTR